MNDSEVKLNVKPYTYVADNMYSLNNPDREDLLVDDDNQKPKIPVYREPANDAQEDEDGESEQGGLSLSKQPTVTETMRQSKKQLLEDVELEIKQRKCIATWRTVLRYLRADQHRKPTAVQIGVFVVFLLVMVITMFKSVIDSSPILFVKTGQEQVGAVDFMMIASNNTGLITGDVNYYALNPWKNPYEVINSTAEDSPERSAQE